MPPLGRAARGGGLIFSGKGLVEAVLRTAVFLVVGAAVPASVLGSGFVTDALRGARFLVARAAGEAFAGDTWAAGSGVPPSAAAFATDV